MVLMGLARSGHAWRQPSRATAVDRGVAPPVPAVRARPALAAGHAEQRRRLGGVRSRHQSRACSPRCRSPTTTPCSIPSCPDITARVLEALGQYGYRPGNPQVDRAIAFIERTQDRRGCWIGRWGVNYLYGTWQVLVGLRSDRLRHAATRWCGGRSPGSSSVQQPCGGWGETLPQLRRPVAGGAGDRRPPRRPPGPCWA